MANTSILQGDPDALLIVRRGDFQNYSDDLISKVISEFVKPESDQPIPQAEALKRWGKTRQTFVNWRKKGLITAYTIDGKIYYKPSELINAMKKISL